MVTKFFSVGQAIIDAERIIRYYEEKYGFRPGDYDFSLGDSLEEWCQAYEDIINCHKILRRK